MDPFLAGAITGVVANALSPMIFHLGGKSVEYTKSSAMMEIRKHLLGFQPKIVDQTRPLLEKLTQEISMLDDKNRHLMIYFLRSLETEQIIREILAECILDERSGESKFYALAEQRFVELYEKYTSTPKNLLSPNPTEVFRLLFDSVKVMIESSLENNLLQAHDIKSQARYSVLRREIENLRKSVEFTQNNEIFSIEEVNQIIAQWRVLIRERYSLIVPPQLETATKVPIDTIYVPPFFHFTCI